MFALASHHSPVAHCAELTPGDAIDPMAIGANTMAKMEIRRQAIIRIAYPESVPPFSLDR